MLNCLFWRNIHVRNSNFSLSLDGWDFEDVEEVEKTKYYKFKNFIFTSKDWVSNDNQQPQLLEHAECQYYRNNDCVWNVEALKFYPGQSFSL